jgi:hypothetical protein
MEQNRAAEGRQFHSDSLADDRPDRHHQCGWRPHRFAHPPNRHNRYYRMPPNGTPAARGDLPKWIMHPMPDVLFGGVVSAWRLLQVAPYVQVSWSRQQAASRAQ